MGWDEWDPMGLNGAEWGRMEPNGAEWGRMNGSEWGSVGHSVGLNGAEWGGMNGTQWVRMGPNGARCDPTVPMGSAGPNEWG